MEFFSREGPEKGNQEKRVSKDKPICKYGSNCYRTNPAHLAEFSHPHRESKDDEKKPSTSKESQISPKDAKQSPPHNVEVSSPPTPSTSGAMDGKIKRKITDFFGKANTLTTFGSTKKIKPIQFKYEEEENYTIDDNSVDDDVTDSLSNADLEKMVAKAFEKSDSSSKRSSASTSDSNASFRKSLASTPASSTELGKSMAAVSVKETPKSPFKELSEGEKKNFNKVIKKLFLLEMPSDFFYLWNFCVMVKRSNPKDVLSRFLELDMVGPYDVLDGTLTEGVLDSSDPEIQEKVLCHWRFYYDVPEFQTVLKQSGSSQVHYGYFRDDPKELPAFVGSNDSASSCTIAPVGNSVFAVVKRQLEKRMKDNRNDEKTKTQLFCLERRLKEYCNEHHITVDYFMPTERKDAMVCKTFHGAGIVVPVENDVGYRPLTITYTNLKKLLKKIIDCEIDRDECSAVRELQEHFTLINFANDECDFGMGLELGINLFCYGDEYFHKFVSFLLNTAYQLLNREEFATIVRAHLKFRRKGNDLDFMNIERIK